MVHITAFTDQNEYSYVLRSTSPISINTIVIIQSTLTGLGS